MFNLNNIFADDMVSGMKKINETFDLIGKSVSKMAQEIKEGLGETGKAYQDNAKAIQDLLKITKSQLDLQKEKNKANKAFMDLQKQRSKEAKAQIDLEKEQIKANKTNIELEKEKIKLSAQENKTAQEKIKNDKKIIDNEKKLNETTQKLIDATIKLNKAKKEQKNVEEAYNKVLETQKQKLKEVSKVHGKMSDEYAKEVKILKDLKGEQTKFNKQLKENKKIADAADDSLAKMTKELGKLKEAYRNASASGRKTLTPQIQKLDKEVTKLNANIGNFQGKVGKYQNAFKGLGGAAQTMGLQLGAAGIAMKALEIGKDALNTWKEFEAGMSRVQAITNSTDETMIQMTATAKEFGKTSVFSATQVSEAMVALGQAGFNQEQIMNSLEGTLNLAAAGAIDLGQAADIASNVMGGFGLSTEHANTVMDNLAYIATHSNTTIESLGESFKEIAPTARALGISMEEVGAGVAILGNSGIKGTDATSSLNSSLLRLSNATPQMAEKMKELGVDFFDANGDFIGMTETVAQLETAFVGLTDEQKAQATTVLFGKNANKQWTTLINEGSETMRQYTSEIENSEGAAGRMAETMTDNLQGAITKFQSAWEGLILSFQVGDNEMGKGLQNMVEMGAEILNLVSDTNFLGETYGALFEPLMEVFEAFGELGKLFTLISGESEEGANKLESFSFILDILVFTTKKALAPTIMLIKYMSTSIKMLAKIGQTIAKNTQPELERFRDIFERLQKIFNIFKEVGRNIIDKVFGKMGKVIKISGTKPIEEFKEVFNELLDGFDWAVGLFEKLAYKFDLVGASMKAINETTEKTASKTKKNTGIMADAVTGFATANQDASNNIIKSNKDIDDSEDKTTQNLKSNLELRNEAREKYGLINVQEIYTKQKEALDKSLQDEYISLQEYNMLLLELEQEHFQNMQEEKERQKEIEEITNLENAPEKDIDLTLTETNDEILSQFEEFGLKKVEINKQTNEQILADNKEFDKENYDRNMSIANSITSVLSTATDLRIKKLESEKNLTKKQQDDLLRLKRRQVLLELGMNQAKAIGSLIAYSFANPLNTVTAGGAGIATYIAGIAQIITNFATAFSKMPKFEKGGVIGGERHSNGGTLIEAEKGEYIMPRNVTEKNFNKFEMLRKGMSFEQIAGSTTIVNTRRLENLQEANNKINSQQLEILKKQSKPKTKFYV
ncbi:MAG: phage tail tape measure protein [Deltaproteobacteria bacterium]|nr:phage tail tape measure protein [Deltaproteobacteria bacterium]